LRISSIIEPASDMSRTRILVAGSINMDDLLYIPHQPQEDGAVSVSHTEQLPGGHGSNCASALAALGVQVGMVGAVGDDSNGRILLEDLASRGIDISCVDKIADEPTGRVIIPSCGNEHHMYVIRGANDKFDPNIKRAIASFRPDALVIFDPSWATFEKLRDIKKVNDIQIPVYWCPGGINAGDPSFQFMLDVSDVAIVNLVERDALFDPASHQAFLKNGRELITTLGKNGARFERGDIDKIVSVSETRVSDTVGAGDAFIAGYVLARLRDLSPENRLQFANAAGAVAVGSSGARARSNALAELAKSLPPFEPAMFVNKPILANQENYL